jgi:hypothetical protein
MKRDALISDCGTFRFTLSREWSDQWPRCAWLMLNPSTADASIDDPTIRRIVKFADAWGYGAVDVVNLAPLRTSQPANLWPWLDSANLEKLEVMLRNVDHIARIAEGAALRVVAFGAEAGARHPDVTRAALEAFRDGAVCLGTNAAGWPLHPMARGRMRVPDNAASKFWRWPETSAA